MPFAALDAIHHALKVRHALSAGEIELAEM
jgi:hypothetical protein